MTPMEELVAASADIASIIGPTCGSCFRGEFDRPDHHEVWKGKGCCGSCASTSGHMESWVTQDEIKALKEQYGFDAHTKNEFYEIKHLGKGFLGKTGCKLPREKRSPVCLAFLCTRAQGVARAANLDPLLEMIYPLYDAVAKITRMAVYKAEKEKKLAQTKAIRS